MLFFILVAVEYFKEFPPSLLAVSLHEHFISAFVPTHNVPRHFKVKNGKQTRIFDMKVQGFSLNHGSHVLDPGPVRHRHQSFRAEGSECIVLKDWCLCRTSCPIFWMPFWMYVRHVVSSNIVVTCKCPGDTTVCLLLPHSQYLAKSGLIKHFSILEFAWLMSFWWKIIFTY